MKENYKMKHSDNIMQQTGKPGRQIDHNFMIITDSNQNTKIQKVIRIWLKKKKLEESK